MIKNYPLRAFFVFLAANIACGAVSAQTSSEVGQLPSAPLNLDVQHIAKELIRDDQAAKQAEKISTDQPDTPFGMTAKHHVAPAIQEISVSGAPERVTKVTGADGSSYCVYEPTIARTDGIDAIQHGLQNQVRTCPQ